MSIPPDQGSGRPDFQPATPPQAPATPPFVAPQSVPAVHTQPPWPQPGMYPRPFPAQSIAAPQRPGSATAASVLGIVGGSLGLAFGIMMTFGSSALFAKGGRFDAQAGVMLMLYGLITLAAAIMLLVAGITHLKGQGHVVLTVGAAMQLLLVLFMMVGMLYSGDLIPPFLIMLLIGLGLGISTLVLTYSSSTRAWRQRRREQRAVPPHAMVR